MEISPRSYYFVSLNENAISCEAIRQLCFGKIPFAIEFLQNLTRISAKAICHKLAHSKEPLQFVQTREFPSPDHFNWAASKISEYFGNTSEFASDLIVLYELKTQKFIEFTKLYDFITASLYKKEITLTLLRNLYNTSRDLFIYLVKHFPNIYSGFNPSDILNSLPNFDYTVFNLISEELTLVKASVDIPENLFPTHLIIMQSALECQNPNLIRNVQDLLGASDIISSHPILNNIQITIAGKQHVDDLFLQPLNNYLEHFQFQAAKDYTSRHPVYLVASYILKIQKFISNRQFLESTISEVMQIPNTPAKFSAFLQYIQNDLLITNNFSQLLGQRISLEDLSLRSLPYISQPIIDTFTIANVKFLKTAQSYCIPSCDIEFYFFASFLILHNILTNFDKTLIRETLMYIDDPQIHKSILVDIFSLIFLKDDKNGFVFSLEKIIGILEILNEYSLNPCKKYIKQGLHKAKYFEDIKETYQLFLPAESLIHPLLIRKEYDKAKSISQSNQEIIDFIELNESINSYIHNLVSFPKFSSEKTLEKFNLEIGLSLGLKENLKKIKDRTFAALIEERMNNNSVECIQPCSKQVKSARNFDKIFQSPNFVLSNSFDKIGNRKSLNEFIDFVNAYINVGATTPQGFKSINVKNTLHFLIQNGKFDLAIEFAGVNRIDFFHLLFVSYRANEQIIKLISPMFPLASFTMALCSMSKDELIKYKEIIIPKNPSSQVLTLFEKRISEKVPKQKPNLVDLILENSPELDDYLYNADEKELKDAVLYVKNRIPLSKFSVLLDFACCFTSDSEIQNLRTIVMFLGQLDDPPQSFIDAVDSVNVERRIRDLTRKQKYSSSRKLSEYCNSIDFYVKYVSHEIENLINNNKSIIEIMKASNGLHHKILSSISKSKYKIRFEVIKSSVELMNDEEISQEYYILKVFLFLPETKRPSKPSIPDIISLLTEKSDIKELERLAKNFDLDFSVFVQQITMKTFSIIQSYGDNISLPLLVPLLSSLMNLLENFSSFSIHCHKFGDSFLPIVALLSDYVVIDCLEHESFCCLVLIHFRVFIKRIQKLASDNIKPEFDNILESLKIVDSLQNISFFAKYNKTYFCNNQLSDKYCQEMYNLLSKEEYVEESLMYIRKFFYSSPNYFFLLLKLHEYEPAREYFNSNIKKELKKNFSLQSNEFISNLFWAIKSPFVVDEEYLKDPNIFDMPKSFRAQIQMYIDSKTPAFFPSSTSECAFYQQETFGLTESLAFTTTCGSFESSFKILFSKKFECNLFLYGILIPSLNTGKFDQMIEFLNKYDEYLENSNEALNYAIIWSRNRDMYRLTYELDILSGDYEDAISMVEILYSIETKSDVRKRILDKAVNEIPREVLSYQKIDYQIKFLSLVKEKGISVKNEHHMFGANIGRTLALLIENKQQQFALTVATDLRVDPTDTCSILAKKYNLSKSKTFISFLQQFCKENVYENWITAFLKSMNESHKNNETVHKLIKNEIKNNKFKCHLLILFGYTDEARQIAIEGRYEEFIQLLSY